jgi:SET domain-containing protein
VDDLNAYDQQMEDLMKYINEKSNDLHLMVVHESKYFRLKSESNENLLKDLNKNCEDIVIVSCNENKKSLD